MMASAAKATAKATADAAKAFAGMYMPSELPSYLSYVRGMNKARASADAMPLYKN